MTVTQYLATLENFVNIRPVRVVLRLGRHKAVYDGALSDQVVTCTEGEHMVTDGGMRPGETYLAQRLDLAGRVAAWMQKKDRRGESKVVYRLDSHDWYVSCWYVGPPTEHHPVGDWFSMMPWPHELSWMGRIDEGEDRPRERATLEIL